jgi:hypothetical protein
VGEVNEFISILTFLLKLESLLFHRRKGYGEAEESDFGREMGVERKGRKGVKDLKEKMMKMTTRMNSMIEKK